MCTGFLPPSCPWSTGRRSPSCPSRYRESTARRRERRKRRQQLVLRPPVEKKFGNVKSNILYLLNLFLCYSDFTKLPCCRQKNNHFKKSFANKSFGLLLKKIGYFKILDMLNEAFYLCWISSTNIITFYETIRQCCRQKYSFKKSFVVVKASYFFLSCGMIMFIFVQSLPGPLRKYISAVVNRMLLLWSKNFFDLVYHFELQVYSRI